jgi:hypothetical protein
MWEIKFHIHTKQQEKSGAHPKDWGAIELQLRHIEIKKNRDFALMKI